MSFPKEGDKIGDFSVDSLLVEHVYIKGSKPRRYEYPVKIIVFGQGDERDVENAFRQLLNQKNVRTTSGYGNPYTCDIGKMKISPQEGGFLIEALGCCVRAPSEGHSEEAKSELKKLESRALGVYNAMFQTHDSSVDIEGVTYPFEKTSASKIKYVKIGGYTFIEQNPKKASRWGEMAQKGHKIMWVCKGPAFLYQVMDGQFRNLRRKRK